MLININQAIMQAMGGNLSNGKCRCCLAKGNHQEVFREAYVEIFVDCLNLFLVTDPRVPQLMCLACFTFLRDVRRFREMVASSERELLKYINKETIFVNVPVEGSSHVKEEISNVKTEGGNRDRLGTPLPCSENKPSSEDIAANINESTLKTELELCAEYQDLSDMETFEDAETEVKNEDEEIIISKLKKSQLQVTKALRKRRLGDRKTRKSLRKRKQCDSESDTPISEIKKKKAKVKKKSQHKPGEIERQIEITHKTLHSKQESLKDNNKIRANIILLLTHSTILPFKNNFKTTYKCFYCEKLYIPFKELRHHIQTEHNDISEVTIDKSLRSLQDLILSADISCIKCRLCEEEFKFIDSLTEHLTNVHNKIYYETVRKPSHGILGFDLSSDTLKCHICDKDFAFFKNLSMHMNEHYGLFVCYVCGKKFLSEHRYKCHVFNHHENKATKCKHCGENFKTEAAMAYHIKKEHLKCIIKCPECPETFSFTQYMKRLNHMAIVHGIKKPVFKCDTCGKEYANSGSLAAHKRYTHKRTKEHRCDICGYITVHNTVMKNHMDVHNGVKNYECEFCKKKFAKPYTLKLHLKIHLNDKRFVCTICDAAFIQKNSLKNHLKARHPDSGIDISKL